MGINRCVLFLDTPLGALEAETVQEKVSQGIKITLRDEGKEEPEIRVQYNPEKKAVEVLLFEAAGQEPIANNSLQQYRFSCVMTAIQCIDFSTHYLECDIFNPVSIRENIGQPGCFQGSLQIIIPFLYRFIVADRRANFIRFL